MLMRLLDFTTLNIEQLTVVLSWRNHPNVRQWMLNTDEISSEDHLGFIESLKQCSDKRYFLVQRSSENVGVIDFTNISEDSAEIGIYANPNVRGVGESLMRTLLDYAFSTLKLTTLSATVFADNQRAKHLYEKFDFTETNRTLYNEREMITMELHQ
ncbi:MAG TPA: UDP-4-amino-4,6-dideoxy-N-acetyl-beta-L-altrosamine N-acetyltransferase [Sulfuricurvum sp.]|nr:UDP-4-amino-4,6-dideoxy-N-acetyl-beta-L-altrosamine N-acetyltransferase [Sulfuricurvum sp.]